MAAKPSRPEVTALFDRSGHFGRGWHTCWIFFRHLAGCAGTLGVCIGQGARIFSVADAVEPSRRRDLPWAALLACQRRYVEVVILLSVEVIGGAITIHRLQLPARPVDVFVGTPGHERRLLSGNGRKCRQGHSQHRCVETKQIRVASGGKTSPTTAEGIAKMETRPIWIVNFPENRKTRDTVFLK